MSPIFFFSFVIDISIIGRRKARNIAISNKLDVPAVTDGCPANAITIRRETRMAKAGMFVRSAVAGAVLALLNSGAMAAAKLPDTILFGVSYYDEYTPVDRVEQDARMMKEAGISIVRIAESTWGTLERSEGVLPGWRASIPTCW
jgi:hypothetical protein